MTPPAATTRKPLLDTAQVAELLGVTDRAVRSLRAEGKLPWLKVGGAVRFDPADVEAFLARCRQGGPRRG